MAGKGFTSEVHYGYTSKTMNIPEATTTSDKELNKLNSLAALQRGQTEGGGCSTSNEGKDSSTLCISNVFVLPEARRAWQTPTEYTQEEYCCGEDSVKGDCGFPAVLTDKELQPRRWLLHNFRYNIQIT